MSDIHRLPGPAPDNPNDQEAGENTPPPWRRRRRATQVPPRDTLLAYLADLLKLVTTGIISSAEAAVARSIVDTLLRHQDDRGAGKGAKSPVNLANLRRALKEQPLLFDALEPLLSDEQLDQILGREGDSHGS